MQDVILDHLHETDTRSMEQLAEDIAYDYGSFEPRSLHRNLAKLIRAGLVKRGEEYALHLGRMNPVYTRLGRKLPPARGGRSRKKDVRLAPINQTPIGPWPGYLVLVVAKRQGGNKTGRGCRPPGARPSLARLVRSKRAVRPPSAKTPGSRPPAASANPPPHPR